MNGCPLEEGTFHSEVVDYHNNVKQINGSQLLRINEYVTIC